jgi:hypothetical protein
MRDIFIALVFIGLVTYPALAALIPNFEMDDETRRSLAPVMGSSEEALPSAGGAAPISSH